jgi:hypothetical protein
MSFSYEDLFHVNTLNLKKKPKGWQKLSVLMVIQLIETERR